jgi:hypothetical protein
MTHAESQDLLLDLAYGELDAKRAAEVEEHVSSCSECRKEKAALEEARRMAAPVRELEEPSPDFEERILRAARAQAQLDHDGNVGQVIEVTGTVRPLGLDAARIDAHGPVKARVVERPRPRWVLRTAVAGSVAAAAALALVVGNNLETRRNADKAASARATDFEIRVQPTPPKVVDATPREAQADKQEKDQGPAPMVGAVPPSEEKRDSVTQLPLRKRVPAKYQGSGGDVVASQGKLAAKKTKEAPPSEAFRGEAPAGSRAGENVSGISQPAPAAPATGMTVPAASPSAREVGARPMAAPTSRSAVSTPAGAFGVEMNAQQARHAGNYVAAASLYREAAAARQREGDPGAAAWDLAHAVECLSAAGQFDEARKVRDELARLHPLESSALSAAQRALREVDVPAAKAPGDPQR